MTEPITPDQLFLEPNWLRDKLIGFEIVGKTPVAGMFCVSLERAIELEVGKVYVDPNRSMLNIIHGGVAEKDAKPGHKDRGVHPGGGVSIELSDPMARLFREFLGSERLVLVYYGDPYRPFGRCVIYGAINLFKI